MSQLQIVKVKQPVPLSALGMTRLSYEGQTYRSQDLVPVELANHVLKIAPALEMRKGMDFAIMHPISRGANSPLKKRGRKPRPCLVNG